MSESLAKLDSAEDHWVAVTYLFRRKPLLALVAKQLASQVTTIGGSTWENLIPGLRRESVEFHFAPVREQLNLLRSGYPSILGFHAMNHLLANYARPASPAS